MCADLPTVIATARPGFFLFLVLVPVPRIPVTTSR